MATTKTEVLMALDVNAETGEAIEREATAEEIANLQTIQTQQAEAETEAQAKAAARASALAKLAELGLTEEEVAAL
jgi:hypothetical protein